MYKHFTYRLIKIYALVAKLLIGRLNEQSYRDAFIHLYIINLSSRSSFQMEYAYLAK